MELGIACQYNRFKHFNFHYIYPISYRNAKKGKPDEMDLPLLKNDITKFLGRCYLKNFSRKHRS